MLDVVSNYISAVKKDSVMLTTFFIVFTCGFFAFISYEKIEHKFVVLVFFVLVGVFYHDHTWKIIKREKDNISRFNDNEKRLLTGEVLVENVYPIHNTPKHIKYIYKHIDLMKALNNLSFIKKYERAGYERIIILLERFYKLYHDVMTGKGSCALDVSQMRDIRMDVLRTISAFYMNVPQFSSHIKGNLYEAIERNLKTVQAITFKAMKITANKCRKVLKVDLGLHKPPYPTDQTWNTHDMF